MLVFNHILLGYFSLLQVYTENAINSSGSKLQTALSVIAIVISVITFICSFVKIRRINGRVTSYVSGPGKATLNDKKIEGELVTATVNISCARADLRVKEVKVSVKFPNIGEWKDGKFFYFKDYKRTFGNQIKRLKISENYSLIQNEFFINKDLVKKYIVNFIVPDVNFVYEENDPPKWEALKITFIPYEGREKKIIFYRKEQNISSMYVDDEIWEDDK